MRAVAEAVELAVDTTAADSVVAHILYAVAYELPTSLGLPLVSQLRFVEDGCLIAFLGPDVFSCALATARYDLALTSVSSCRLGHVWAACLWECLRPLALEFVMRMVGMACCLRFEGFASS